MWIHRTCILIVNVEKAKLYDCIHSHLAHLPWLLVILNVTQLIGIPTTRE